MVSNSIYYLCQLKKVIFFTSLYTLFSAGHFTGQLPEARLP